MDSWAKCSPYKSTGQGEMVGAFPCNGHLSPSYQYTDEVDWYVVLWCGTWVVAKNFLGFVFLCGFLFFFCEWYLLGLFHLFFLQLKLWEFRINILARELLTDTRKSFNLVFHVVPLGLVHVDLYKPAAVQFHAHSLAHNLTWENQILQDCIVHGCQSVAPGTPLLIFCMAFSSWLRQNSPLSAKDNVRPTELFLPSRLPACLGFSGKISVEEKEQRLS